MGEATGLAKGLRRRFGVEPDLDICGKRGATVVLPKPAAIDVTKIEETIARATYTLKAVHVRARGKIVERDGKTGFVLAGSGQTVAFLRPELAQGFVGRDVEAVTSWIGWEDASVCIDAIHFESTRDARASGGE